MRTNPFVCTVCRFADGGDMSPPYSDWFKNGSTLCRVGTCPHRCRNYQMRTNPFPTA